LLNLLYNEIRIFDFSIQENWMPLEKNNELIPWLLNSEPWIEYRTRLDLLDQSRSDPEVNQTYQSILTHPAISNIINELSEWPSPILKSHKKAGHFLHKLGFLADIGLKADNPGINKIVQRITDHRSPDGVFQVLVNINPRYGGTGEDQLAWMLCDAPLVTYALAKFEERETQLVSDSVEQLVSLQRDNGWPCAASPELGKFRGPGRKADPCPYANLVMLKLLALFPEKHADTEVKTGVETILSLWEQRTEKRPYLFAMGTDFLKLKAPSLWYDILHVTDVLTQFPWALKDKRLHQMIEVLRSKAGPDGKFTPESIWMDWKGWEFSQKKEPSKWVSLTTQRILNRVL
jgi:hypothetical protein